MEEEIRGYLLHNSVKDAKNLLLIEKYLNDFGFKLPDNITVHSGGIEFLEFKNRFNSKFNKTGKNLIFPKTYKECCEILNCKSEFYTEYLNNENEDIIITDYEDETDNLLLNFRKLKYCRDAYWKLINSIPKDAFRYCITCCNEKIIKHESISENNYFLIFPTEEICNEFYENFKQLIESCKELL